MENSENIYSGSKKTVRISDGPKLNIVNTIDKMNTFPEA